MTAVFNFIILVVVGISALAAVFFILRALQLRSQSTRETYGVGQVEARQAMQINIARGVAFIFVGLILLGVYGLNFGPANVIPLPTSPPPTTIPPTITIVATDPAATAATAVSTPTTEKTTPSVAPSATFTLVPTETPSPEPEAGTATVTSGVGVWLRETPGTAGAQLEWVLDGTVLTLLPGLQAADEFEWQEVRTPNGNEGWVATEFIEYNEQ